MSKARNIWSDYKCECDAAESAASIPRKERGASMPFALLLFLICALLASVILAAGTASAGRLSQLMETDQQYYAVTSTVDYVQDLFKNGATIQCIESEGPTKSYQMKVVPLGGKPVDITSGADQSDFSLAEISAIHWLLNKTDMPSGQSDCKKAYISSAYDSVSAAVNSDSSDKLPPEPTYKLAPDPDTSPDDIIEALDVSIKQEILSNGCLQFEIKSNDTSGKPAYQATLVFDVDIDVNEYESKTPGSDVIEKTRELTFSWATVSYAKGGR